MSLKHKLLMMALSLNAACGGGGGSDDQARSTGSAGSAATATAAASTSNSGWLTVVVGGINPTPRASAELHGRAFVSRLRSSCCTNDPADAGVSMSWQNLDTGETGTPEQHPGYSWALVWFLDKSGQNWDASVPLRVGSNTLVVTATDGLVVASQAVTVIRIVDDAPPVVTMTSPVDGATGVSPATALSITFSEEVYPPSISPTTILVKDALGNRVDGRVSYAAGVATFTPLADLKENTSRPMPGPGANSPCGAAAAA
jgi:hypothetical protein